MGKRKYEDMFHAGQRFGNRTVVDGSIIPIKNGVVAKYAKGMIELKCKCGTVSMVDPGKLLKGLGSSCRHCANGSLDRNFNWKGAGKVTGRYFNQVKRGADKRGLEFSLTIEYMAQLFRDQNERCALTGEQIYFSEARKYKMETSASLDRIDNNKGYIEGNVQFVSKEVNFMKHKLTEDRFVDICEKVIDLRKKKKSPPETTQ